MQTFCLSCRKDTNNVSSKKVIMEKKVNREVPRCANCMIDKSRFLKQKSNKKLVGIILILNVSYTNHYKTS